MQLILLRHGRPEGGGADPDLCELGRKQAQEVSAALLESGVSRIVSSPMRRALRTAEPTAEALGLDDSVIDGLAEADRFAPNYRSVEELRNDPEAWSRFLADPIAFLGGDAATFKLGVLQAIGPLLTNSKTKVAVFTHGLPINVVLSHALGLERITHFVPHYCSITRLNGESLDDLSVVSVNETTFLRS
jgi:probable phosphoglycerate mutase